MTQQEIEFLKTLSPTPYYYGGTGALKLHFDPKDFDLRSDPKVAAKLPTAAPPNGDILNFILGPPDNQGASPACVAFSTGNGSSIDEAAVANIWESYDCAALYIEAGGNGTNGVDTRVVLDIAVKQGIPYAGGRRKVIGSYAFVPQQLGIWRETIKASILAGQPVTLALLLPIPFGWNSGTVRSSGYHQVIVCGWMTDAQGVEWWIVFNSWGPGWPGEAGSPKPGVGRVRCDYIEADGFQNSYAYAYGTQRVAIPNPTPVPTPTPLPTPTPTPIIVSGYTGTALLPSVRAGSAFVIQGSGFAGGNLTVQMGGQPLVANRGSDASIVCTAPAQAIVSAVQVRVEGSQADGPLLAVTPSVSPTPAPTPIPTPTPDPIPTPGGLLVQVPVHRYSDTFLGVWAYVSDATTHQPVVAQITGMVGSVALAPRETAVTSWSLKGDFAGPQAVTISAKTADGRTGTGQATV